MGRIDIILSEDLEEKFRNAVYKKYGMKRGNLTEAVHEALESWIKTSKIKAR